MTQVRHEVHPIEQLAVQWPADVTSWLSLAEQEQMRRYRDEARRRQGLAARWLSKQLVSHLQPEPVPLAAIEVCSRDGRGRAVRPQVFLDGRMQNLALGIAHSQSLVAVVLASGRCGGIGVDLTPVTIGTSRWLTMWLTDRECQWIDTLGDYALPLAVWSIKEAVYKAAHRGESFSPRRVEVTRDHLGAFQATYLSLHGSTRCGIQLRQFSGHVMTIATISGRSQIVGRIANPSVLKTTMTSDGLAICPTRVGAHDATQSR